MEENRNDMGMNGVQPVQDPSQTQNFQQTAQPQYQQTVQPQYQQPVQPQYQQTVQPQYQQTVQPQYQQTVQPQYQQTVQPQYQQSVQPQYQQSVQPQYQQPVQQGYMTPPPFGETMSYGTVGAIKKTSKAPIIAVVSVLVAALVGGGIFLLTRGDNPVINLNGKSSTYERAERDFVKNGLSAYSAFDKLSETSVSGEVTITFTPEEYIIDFLRDNLYMDIPDKINPTTFTIQSAVKDNDLYAAYAYKNGGKEIISADIWLKGDELVLYIPKLAEKYLKMAVDINDISDSFSYASVFDGMDAMANLPAPPSEKEFEKIYNAVWDEYFDITKNAPVQKNVDVSLGGISLKCDAVEIDITEEMAYKLALALMKAVDKSDETKAYINSVVRQSGGYYYSDFEVDSIISEGMNALETMISDLKGTTTDTLLTMVVYTNGGNVVKREISMKDYSSFSISYTSLESKGKYETEMVYKADDNLIKYTDSGEKKSNAYSGVMKISVKYKDWEYDYDTWESREVDVETSVNATYSGLTFDKDDNITGGEIVITSGSLNLGGDSGEISIKLSFKENGFKGSLELGYVKVATVEITYSEGFSGKPFPALTSDNTVSIDGDDYYALDEISEQVIENLAQIAGNLDDNGVYDIVGYIFSIYATALGGDYYYGF
ncbi:MAG: hypothetical protein LBI36_05510 [Oscillospiraceae bacterium]|nr:hypothetical protein [Oscillospiraceae bacterium]